MDRFITTLNNIKKGYGEYSELELRALLDSRKYNTYVKYTAGKRCELIDNRLSEYKSQVSWSITIDRKVCRQIITFPNAESKTKTSIFSKLRSIFSKKQKTTEANTAGAPEVATGANTTGAPAGASASPEGASASPEGASASPEGAPEVVTGAATVSVGGKRNKKRKTQSRLNRNSKKKTQKRK